MEVRIQRKDAYLYSTLAVSAPHNAIVTVSD